MTRLHLTRHLALRIAVLSLVGCTSNPSQKPNVGSLYAATPYNVKLSLTDAPNAEVKSVVVNVHHAELRVSRNGKEGRLIVAENLGAVDLLTLQNGVTLPMAQLSLPLDTVITQIRLVLNETGNYLSFGEGRNCDLQTPSQQKTGIKFIIHDGVAIESGYSYSIVADFDAKKSIVIQGNGGCLLKPVLKLKSASRISVPPPTEGGGTSDGGVTDAPIEEPVAGPDDSTQIPDEGGPNEPDVPVISPENL